MVSCQVVVLAMIVGRVVVSCQAVVLAMISGIQLFSAA